MRVFFYILTFFSTRRIQSLIQAHEHKFHHFYEGVYSLFKNKVFDGKHSNMMLRKKVAYLFCRFLQKKKRNFYGSSFFQNGCFLISNIWQNECYTEKECIKEKLFKFNCIKQPNCKRLLSCCFFFFWKKGTRLFSEHHMASMDVKNWKWEKKHFFLIFWLSQGGGLYSLNSGKWT